MKNRFQNIYLLAALLVVLAVFFGFINNEKYGYSHKTYMLNYPHYMRDALVINGKRVLILGNDKLPIPEPCEIFDIEKNSVIDYNLSNNLKISGNGISLKNNKILLKNVCIADSMNCSDLSNYNISNFIVYDIVSNQIQNFNILDKNESIIEYTLLENGNVAMIVAISENQITNSFYILIYNPDNNTIIKSDVYKAEYVPLGLVQISKNEILIAGNIPYLLKYNINENKFIQLNLKAPQSSEIILIKSYDKVLMFGEENNNFIYNIKHNTLENMPPMHSKRNRGYTVTPVDDKYILIAGGEKFCVPNPFNYVYCSLHRSVELYDVENNMFTKAPNSMKYGHVYHNAVKLSNGNIIIIDTLNKFKLNNAKGIGVLEIFNFRL